MTDCPSLAVELVRRQVAVIATADIASAFAAKSATTTIPIVFNTSLDPVATGLVASLNRPGGNVTGITSLNTEVISKRLEMLHELVPAARIIALLVNPTSPKVAEANTTDAQAATRALGLELRVVSASSQRDTAFMTLAQQGTVALAVSSDPLFNSLTEQIAALASRHAIPAIYPLREYVAAGGLISYGTSLSDIYRQVGIYTAKILKGEKPAEGGPCLAVPCPAEPSAAGENSTALFTTSCPRVSVHRLKPAASFTLHTLMGGQRARLRLGSHLAMSALAICRAIATIPLRRELFLADDASDRRLRLRRGRCGLAAVELSARPWRPPLSVNCQHELRRLGLAVIPHGVYQRMVTDRVQRFFYAHCERLASL
jgi:hypothetical protein